jgi:hypothetical protein
MVKTNTLKLPKAIAGVKVPKFLRHPGTILEILNSPAGRLVIAEVLIAAAAALKNYKPAAEPVDPTAESTGRARSEPASAAKDPGQGTAAGSADRGVARRIVPASAGDDAERGPPPARRGRPRKDKSTGGPSTH